MAKATALFIFLVVLEVIAVPAFGLLLLGPPLGPVLPGADRSCSCSATSALAVIGTLVSAIAVHTRARDLIGPVIGLPLLIPALIGTARGVGPLLARPRVGIARRRSGWRSWLFMIWCSHCSPTRCSTSSWRI